ncbi:MAG: Do family serine endopeptidase [Synergistaceae bacterium]|nr:Do family serine endopeptidase [Synergistaceae bacterium]
MRVKKFPFRPLAMFLVALAALCVFAPASPAPAAPAALERANNPVVRIVKDVSPAVVNIDVETIARRSRISPFQNDPLFRRFFGEEFERFTRSVPMRGRGSGFVVSKDGQILTNNHVVDGTDKITVTMSDGRTYEAEVLGKDPTFDLAVIKINPESELTVLELGDSDLIEVGESVVAIGNPYGFEHTVTVGVISAKNRSVHARNINFDGFLQTDAAINPGNSGGPLIDMDGKVIGINTAIIPYAQGLGFAIPVNMAKQIMDDLVTHGRVKRGWLGVSVQNMTREFAEAYNIKEENGVIVGDVLPDSAAERAKIQRGDVIVSLNGEQVKDVQWFVGKIRSQAPGAELKLKVVRSGRTIDVTVKLDEIPESEGGGSASSDSGDDFFKGIGLNVTKPTDELRRRYRIESRVGLVVTGVADGSPTQRLGLREGDVILEVNGKKVNELSDVDASAGKSGASVVLLIERDGRTFFVSLKTE